MTAAAALDADLFRVGLEARETALREARLRLHENGDRGIGSAPVVHIDGRPVAYEVFGEDVARDRAWIRRYVRDVTLRSSGGKRVPVEQRLSIQWRA